MKISANLSYLFTEAPFLERFALAAEAGFSAVEFHFPYEFDLAVIAEVQLTSEMDIVLFNLPAGNWAAGERGIACHPTRISEFRRGVSEAIAYAKELSVPRLNCLAGIPPVGVGVDAAQQTLIDNVRWAAEQSAQAGIELLIEPLNTRDTPGFLIATSAQALALIDAVNHPNVRLQLDLYHEQIMAGDLTHTLRRHLARIGHIQFADAPDRHEPGTGELNFAHLFGELTRLGYDGYLGAEYRPLTTTAASLHWWRAHQASA
jgi:hydroxypyruvate isomerase